MNHGLPPENWDVQLSRHGGSFLQSRPWAEVQQALGRETYWEASEQWCWLASRHLSRGLRYGMAGYGPTGENADSVSEAIASLRAAGQRLGVDFVRIEPQAGITAVELRQLGAVKIAEADPEHSRIVDLRQDEGKLRSDLTSGHRNLINGTQRRGIRIRQSQDPRDYQEFLGMLHETANRAHVTFYPDGYYQTLWEVLGTQGIAKLYVAEAEGQPVAAALFYDWEGTRYYAHAGAHQELNRQVKASVSLVWQALVDAKQAGLHSFDLWGVAPEGDNAHRLASLSRFKHGFGGRQADYLGTWDIPLKRNKYRLYAAYRRLRGRSA